MKFPLLATAIFVAASTCQAEVLQFRFQFTGFEILPLDRFWDPEERVMGYFSGEDRNGDSAIDRSELLAFQLNGQSYFGCSGTRFCNVDYFSYKPLEVVRFSAGSGNYIPHVFYSSRYFQSIDFTRPFQEDHIDEYDHPVLGATLQTGYSIMPGVPEPASTLMFAAGLVMMARRLCRCRASSGGV